MFAEQSGEPDFQIKNCTARTRHNGAFRHRETARSSWMGTPNRRFGHMTKIERVSTFKPVDGPPDEKAAEPEPRREDFRATLDTLHEVMAADRARAQEEREEEIGWHGPVPKVPFDGRGKVNWAEVARIHRELGGQERFPSLASSPFLRAVSDAWHHERLLDRRQRRKRLDEAMKKWRVLI
jgi:hypothetical protein